MSGVGQPQLMGANRAGSQSVDNKNAPASFVNNPARGWLHPDNLIAKVNLLKKQHQGGEGMPGGVCLFTNIS